MSTKRFVAKHGLDNNSQTISNVANPVDAQDAATKAFAADASNLASGTVAYNRLPDSGVTANTYRSVTVDAKGRVTAGTNPTTLAGYGITDAAPSSHVGATGAAHGNATTSVSGFMSATDKTKLDGIESGAQVNQSAFSNIAVSGQTTVAADSATDTVTFAAGTGVTITTDAANDVVTITNSAPDQTVSITGSGATSVTGTYPNFTISSTDTNTTYSLATSTVPGLVELGSDTVQSVAANAVTATAARTYALQLNAAGQAVVNVPWTDNNTTYSAGAGLSLSSTTFSLGTPSTLTTSTTNSSTGTTHTHAVTFPVTSVNTKTGAVSLTAADVAAIPSSEKGAANGVATLDASGLVPSTQLPSYVDDVLEYANLAGFPTTGEAGKIYVAIDTNKTYRWSGSAYVYITSGAVDSVAGKTGVVVLDTLTRGTGLSGSNYNGSAATTWAVSYGSTAGTAVQGNDVRVTADQAAGTASIRTLGTGAQQAAAGNHTHTFDSLTSKPTTLSGYGITDAVASNTAITAGTATKITYDAKGLVTAGTTLAASDIPNLDANKITSGTIGDARLPTRLGTIAKSVTDWDTAIENGWYMGTDAANAPTVGWIIGTSENHGAAGWCTQLVHAFSSDSEIDTKTYRRERNNGVWGTWQRVRLTQSEQSAIYLNASNLNAGTVPTARLGSGTASSTTFLAGDSTWKTVTSGATLSNDTTTNTTYYPTFATATSGAMTTAKVASTKLTFNPSTGALTATDFNATSDERKKTDIQTASGSIVNRLRGVEFKWVENDKQSAGVIAQEVETVIPHAVNTDEDGFKSVNYNSLVAYLIEALKDQQKQIDELKTLIANK